MMSTLPSPPLSPTETTYTNPPTLTTSPTVSHRSKHRKDYQRHQRYHDTYELLQALVKEHQKLEQQEYDSEVRETPTLFGHNDATTKGILIHPTAGSSSTATHDPCSTTLSLMTEGSRRPFASTSLPSSPSSLSSSSSLPSPPSPSVSSPRSPALVRFAVGPPRIYRYPKLPTLQES